MKIKDEGLIIGQKKYGENSLIVNILSKHNGPIKGLYKFSKKSNKGLLLDHVMFNWKSRINDGLGYVNFETLNCFFLTNEPHILTLLKVSITELCLKFLPLRDVNINIYLNLIELLDSFKNNHFSVPEFLKKFILWEIEFLSNLGYAIDFSKCSVSGEKDNLIYISPKSGNVVSEKVGDPWRKKLLKIPSFIIYKESTLRKEDIINGLLLTDFFFNRILENIFSNQKGTKLIFKKQLLDFILKAKDF